MKKPVFVCVYRSGGGVYTRAYVEKLKESIDRYSSMEFVCLSDDPEVPGYIPLAYDWPGWWSKMELFRPDILQGTDILYMDLDTVLSGPISPIEAVCGRHTLPILLQDFYVSDRLASGVMWLPERYRPKVWNLWQRIPDAIMEECGSAGDQAFIGGMYKNLAQTWQSVLPDMFASYKCHIAREGVPGHIKYDEVDVTKARVVCYHGRPRPDETDWEGNDKLVLPSSQYNDMVHTHLSMPR